MQLDRARGAHVARRDEALLVQRADGDDSSATIASAGSARVTSPVPSLRQTTSSKAGEAEQQPEPLLRH